MKASNNENMAALRRTQSLIAIAVWCAIATCASAICGGEMPAEPQPGQSQLVSILVDDPNIGPIERHGCQMAKFDPFLSLDCARVEGVEGAIQGKEGIKFCSVA